jgi:hypothetical protein
MRRPPAKPCAALMDHDLGRQHTDPRGSVKLSRKPIFIAAISPVFFLENRSPLLLFKAAASAAQQYLPPTGLVTPLLSRSITTFTETRSSYRVRRFPSSSSSSSGSCLVGRLFVPRLVEVASSFFFPVLQPKSSVVSHLPPWTIASNLATYLQPSSRSLHLTS